MYLREAFTLLIDYSHNMDPKQIICIKSQICTLTHYIDVLTLRSWSPNRKPPRAAAEPDFTKHSNTPCERD